MSTVAELSVALTGRVRDVRLGFRGGEIVVTAGAVEGTYGVGYCREGKVVRRVDDVCEGDIVRAAERLVVQEFLGKLKGRGGDSGESGVSGFELVNGYMTIWGGDLWVGCVVVDGHGVERVEPWVTNARMVYVVMDDDGCVRVHVGKGCRTGLFSERTKHSKKLRFVVDGETVDVGYDLLVRYFTVDEDEAV